MADGEIRAVRENVAETISMSLYGDEFGGATPIEDVEVSENGFESPRLRGMHEREILAGLGFSLGIHAIVLVLALLTILFFMPPCIPEASFITISLVSFQGGPEGPSGEQGSVAGGQGPARAALPGSSPTEDIPERKTEMNREITRQSAEPKKQLRAQRKAVTLKDKERPAGTNKSVAEPTGDPAADRAEASTSPAVPSGGTAGGDAGSGGGLAGGGLRGRGGGGSKEFNSEQVDTPPSAIRKVEPEFPRAARQMGITGRVVVRFLVKIDGSVGKASVIEANPRGIFEQSALDAIDKWRFKPGRHRGDVVATWVLLPIQFRLYR